MVKELWHAPLFLAAKSADATAEDRDTAKDLLDTLMAHADACVGMAANMIGVRKRIIAFLDESGKRPVYTVMFNPEILRADGAYQTEEGCLSIPGIRKTRRYKKIKVKYLDLDMKPRIATYEGVTAQAIQHEIDHLDGILI